MEYCSQRSLWDVLYCSGRSNLTWSVKHKIALDIATGLYYLHSNNIVHRDLKSLNILVDEYDRAKIGDFGLARIKTENMGTTTKDQEAGTSYWMPPEVILRQGKWTKAGDIYSFGIILWEIAARCCPDDQQVKTAWIIDLLSRGERQDIPADTPPSYAHLIRNCWQQAPTSRPTAEACIQHLANISLI